MKNHKRYISLVLLAFVSCSTTYNVHIRTVPEGDYNIYFDKKPYGAMPSGGDTTIQFPKVSVFNSPKLEIKGVDRYGYFEFNAPGQQSRNVKSRKTTGFKIKTCDIDFDFNVPVRVETPPLNQRLQDSIVVTRRIRNLAALSKIHYCAADLRLLQKKSKVYDPNNTEYKLMKKYVDYNMTKNGYVWDTINTDLTRRITLGLADDTTNTPDSLPYAAWDLASTQNIKCIVVFYGYSLLVTEGVAPGTVAASAALTGLGVLAGLTTGLYVITYPTGKDIRSAMEIHCAIFSVMPNRCMFRTKASITTFNNSNVEGQIVDLYDRLFKKINPVFASGGAANSPMSKK